jgi:hypothetical protein
VRLMVKITSAFSTPAQGLRKKNEGLGVYDMHKGAEKI